MHYTESMGDYHKSYQTDLRFGCTVLLYYRILGKKLPRQLDLLEEWFPRLVITVDESDGNTKVQSTYSDLENRIHAVYYHGSLYSGGSTRVSQILGRLIGTAEGNQEKEREAASEIQMRIAQELVSDMQMMPGLQENAAEKLSVLTQEQQSQLFDKLYDLVYQLKDQRIALSGRKWIDEPFAMNPESFDECVYNAAYQLKANGFEGLCNAWLWLLLGGLLRNEIGRIARVYHSNLVAVDRQMAEDGTLEDRINFLFHPEQYESYYEGDDLENRFPGMEWYCDHCNAYLNDQEGFDDHLSEWKCTQCGHINRIDRNELYDSREDWINGIRSDPEKFDHAIEKRKKEK